MSEPSDGVLVTALNLMTDGMVLVDSAGIILFANIPLHNLLGYEPGELVGHPLELLVPAADRDTHQASRKQFDADPVARPMGRAELDIEAQHADGRRIPVDVQLTPVGVSGVTVACVRDMTRERKAAAARAIERFGVIETIRKNEQMIAYYDILLQRLYALGTHFAAEANRETAMRAPFFQAATAIDQLIVSTRTEIFEQAETSVCS
jgi:PAS domain S-box-containing protein